MFEEMRDAGLARRLVGGADLVPDHVGDDRRAAVRDDHDLEAVGEREVADVRRRAAAGELANRAVGDGADGNGGDAGVKSG